MESVVHICAACNLSLVLIFGIPVIPVVTILGLVRVVSQFMLGQVFIPF